ncbi:response regulator transcription factor [Paenibacillus chondroitinus]|uniref:Response regulator transcription factor n=1 Tax=Paenibacillus chondroitinus TaxID=59842 RepID=A0ABU6D3J6_9BACL|nr:MULTISPECIES: response regulator transcription factor [Paenibacillus]MCY9660903.1 response regulator transcription factor [Paenibacillus anseongense]MEB4792299.1 response regulator transcription factor [Paenibacillus chondroitinus]
MYKVLIIEDDPMIGDMISMYLGEEGFEVIRMETGQKGIEAVKPFAPDVILLDLMLPDMDGLELCRQVRTTLSVPIMIVSMRNKVVERVAALGAGADDYMCKPFSMHEMSARVHALIRRSNLYQNAGDNMRMNQAVRHDTKPETDEALLGDKNKITLDLQTRSMIVQGQLVETTYSEFEIMKCFVNHPGRVYTREDLLQTVRGFDSYVTDRAIDVHIANLRKKIEDNPKEPRRIRTVWGVGYKFVY